MEASLAAGQQQGDKYLKKVISLCYLYYQLQKKRMALTKKSMSAVSPSKQTSKQTKKNSQRGHLCISA